MRVRTKITSSSRREREDNHRLITCPFNGMGELVLARSRPLEEHEELLIELDLTSDFLCPFASDGFDQGFLFLDYGRFGSLEPGQPEVAKRLDACDFFDDRHVNALCFTRRTHGKPGEDDLLVGVLLPTFVQAANRPIRQLDQAGMGGRAFVQQLGDGPGLAFIAAEPDRELMTRGRRGRVREQQSAIARLSLCRIPQETGLADR